MTQETMRRAAAQAAQASETLFAMCATSFVAEETAVYAFRLRTRAALLLSLAALLAGCGRSKRETVAGCLNDEHGFLVTGGSRVVEGQSPSGATFTLRIRGGRSSIDDSGNPGSRRLTAKERAAIGSCVAKRGWLRCARPRRGEIPNRVRSGRKQP